MRLCCFPVCVRVCVRPVDMHFETSKGQSINLTSEIYGTRLGGLVYLIRAFCGYLWCSSGIIFGIFGLALNGKGHCEVLFGFKSALPFRTNVGAPAAPSFGANLEMFDLTMVF